ncbi:hypothetical protein KSF78_0007296, partial [Schistosoma japonicum]
KFIYCTANYTLFTKLSEQDKTFLKQRPDLTQPHCINQENKCALKENRTENEFMRTKLDYIE